jgi:hypothetical protein
MVRNDPSPTETWSVFVHGHSSVPPRRDVRVKRVLIVLRVVL